MATTAQWIEGARPRTLPNAIAPVLVGTGAAVSLDAGVWWKALLALIVSLALIVGVNFANDYSDGIRGTDDDRVGPLRLVGSKAASAGAVKRAAIGCFAVGAVAGLVLAATSAWWLVIVGLICIAGAWYYTGGSKPYGYSGFGEIAVFVFFGLVAVLGTQYVQAEQIDWAGVLAAVAVGSFSSAVLVANNLRDIPTDTESGKRTLAVRLGDTRTRYLHLALLVVPFAMTVALIARTPWALVALLALPLAARANSPVRGGAHGFELIPALRDSGLAMLVWGAATGVALAFA
ncbi:1,4-dihydroxy-2-naphthoate polyprenyltransferase [Rhodococcus fascians]|jgi:1,4-dihydroxy-2-naphthoate octaprenyltransferase|uniref:1,4-dihydroxy-2-naphthoate polyprenyltransferase n=1 Tax=Nocardiaceae TaxID=85025 RepID=UPI00050BED51|nr:MULTISPECIES: 1,4-dihydroxy-2-naphthoate polyprenyltransferase [Rhodococcus]KJV04598.1 1,4-dihydroxy-2-naphthoate octaprenyltransferase [Rhodococcus sp. PML026]KQU37394.1 1,4-dihydroxy-2-naphthoate octaprenyltransferase [Rhodococcus sp. Leaf233]MBM7243265.1 1,4-dihydroxy-2-naphthoate polyprenyltransferase [Rhodococcus fascians]MBX5329741.1 1,4-dihydroxy-2-naphthoate polyprenyltransferase [Rhodococcus fascians]MBY3794171.1 1,4-dihydroxy-2-naphthoate polyprenyltransferase [Rhodococcus fascian